MWRIIFAAITAAVSVGALVAYVTTPEAKAGSALEGPVRALLSQHAEISGQLADCGTGHGRSSDDLVDLVANWGYPGTFPAITGQRKSYRHELETVADVAFRRGYAQGCPGLLGHYKVLLDSIEPQLRRL